MTTIAGADVAVTRALEQVYDPCSMATGTPLNVLEMGLVRDVEQREGSVRIVMCATTPSCVLIASIMEGVHDAVSAVPGVEAVDVQLDAEVFWTPDLMDPEAHAALNRRRGALARRLRPQGAQPAM